MKKFTLIAFLLSLSIGIFAQSTPVSDIRVATAATEFKINLPVGTKVYNIADSTYWVATTGVVGTKSLTTAASSFKQLNANFTTFVTIAQTTGQTIGTTTNRLTKLWATALTVTDTIYGSISGNAKTVTTNANLTGDVTSVGNVTTIPAKAVKLAMMDDIVPGLKGSILGRGTTSTGAPEVISIGAGLVLTGTTLTAAGLGGTVTKVSVVPVNGVSGTVSDSTINPAISIILGNIKPTSVAATGTVSGTQLISTIATGTAPFVVTSTTPVANLNIDGNAKNVTGIVTVAHGGTGLDTLTVNSYMIGAGTANVKFKTPSQVLTDIGAAPVASASLFMVDSFSEATTGTSGQVNTLTKTLKPGSAVQVILNGTPLIAITQFTVTVNTVQITIPVYQYDAVTISYGY